MNISKTISYFKNILNFYRDKYCEKSYAQEGEDRLLCRIFEKKTTGFYVDVGAHHPMRFSNTYLFYKKGWSGINIDAMPGSMNIFKRLRPRDINIETGVGQNEGAMEYFIFNEPALNGFSKTLSKKRDDAENSYKIIDVRKIQIQTLEKILSLHLPINTKIDFPTIDVEGLDFDVLKSSNWSLFRPSYVLVEILESSLHEIIKTDVYRFMAQKNYEIYAKCVNTVFFRDSDQ